MTTSVELSVLQLITGASLFTKVILGLLLVFSILSWAIILQKHLFLGRYRKNTTKFLNTITNQGSIDSVEQSCTKFSSTIIKTVPVILMKLIHTHNQGRKVISPRTIMNNAVLHESNKLQSSMPMLATAANASPLIGLLGTVWGIMYSFIRISELGSATISTVAPGIAEALITTIAGLLVAIPAMIGHNFLSLEINRCMDQLERINEFAVSLFEKDVS